ncbi:MAG: hypothetical protein PUF48_07035 [Oscillospiraceae bacterium]|nr:hypothetical protein [Oscillospiraceae bacterium]
MFKNAKWIWPTEKIEKNQRANFFFSAECNKLPDSATLCIACETKYWLFVNGELVVFDGGLFRESIAGCGYFERVDISKYLQIGKNEITVHVWYYGNGGRNNSFCEKPGLLLYCEELSLATDEKTACEIDTAYTQPSDREKTFIYGGNHTVYNAKINPFSLCPKALSNNTRAVVLGEYGDKPWGDLVERVIPPLFFSERTECKAEKTENGYIVSLPYAMHFSPYFKIRAVAGTKIEVHSDRYSVNGGPGDFNSYFGHRAEYTCCDGEQEFEMFDWIFGEKIIFIIPKEVEIIELGYRESGYDSEVTTSFTTDNADVNILFEKCVRTLKVCMRENYMDCPDRERGQWIGDVSVQAPQVVYLLDKNGLLLLKKAIYDFINLRKGDKLVGNVPGDNFLELPSQSLNAISELGMIATYYNATKDKEILALAFEPAVKYLMLWETDKDGVVLRREGSWEWYDHLFNCDKEILNICWYYSALKFAKTMADELGDHRYDTFIQERMTSIEKNFEARYWRGEYSEGYFASGDFVDDRANAMAVLSGLCDSEKYPRIRYLLMSVFNSTTYMENYVLMALCEMGYKQDAFRRMMCRYQPLIHNENSTLWEDFFHLGTRNHAWSGGAASILLRYFAGINADLSIKDTDISPLKQVKCKFTNCNTGETKEIERK